MPKITRIEIKSYRGIRDLSIAVPPEGAVISGGNARGKSSVLKAITAALAGQGIGPEAIHLGDDQAEILVDLEAIRVRRSITAKGSSLTVKNAEGDNWSKPQTRLNELFGTASLDALAFFLAKPEERRRMVLEALPVTVTPEDVARWAPGATKALEQFSLDGHGLEVLERLHRFFYGVRTDVNRAAKTARAEADAAGHYPPGPDEAPTVEAALEANTAAARRLGDLLAREGAARETAKATERTRELVEDARWRAKGFRDRAAGAPTGDQVKAADDEHAGAAAEVVRLEELLAAARAAESQAALKFKRLSEAHERATSDIIDANAEDARANQLQETIASVEAIAVPEADIAAARAELERTESAMRDAEDARRAARAATDHQRLLEVADKREADAAQLDAIVRRLATEAPQELADRSALIPGLGVNGDTITLDGVSISELSGAEQMRFAVDLCKRLNAKAKILVVDGLERLDEDSLEAFVETATAGGWQLIGTRVSKGELVVEALAPARKVAA